MSQIAQFSLNLIVICVLLLIQFFNALRAAFSCIFVRLIFGLFLILAKHMVIDLDRTHLEMLAYKRKKKLQRLKRLKELQRLKLRKERKERCVNRLSKVTSKMTSKVA